MPRTLTTRDRREVEALVHWQNPGAWVGLLALALPILVHLFSQRPARVVPFPSLRFLEVSRLLPTRRTQLSDLPLLIVRLAILTCAVAALAQPLWQPNRAPSSTSAARVIVMDTLPSRGDSVARASLEREAVRLQRESGAAMRIESGAPFEVLDGAVAWLQTQSGRGELVVLSDFRHDALDSLDIAAVPSDITVRLVRAPAVTSGADSSPATPRDRGVVRWTHATTPSIAAGVRNTVHRFGGTRLADSSAAKPTGRAWQVIVVASPDADSLSSWVKSARPLSQAWMGDVIYALRGDSTLVTAAAASAVADTTISAPFVVVARSLNQAPLVAVAALDGVSGAPRLLVWSRAPADNLVTAALLLSASNALDHTRRAGNAAFTSSDLQLRRWERAPAGAVRAVNTSTTRDPFSGTSDARFLWLAVLLLLGVETLLRMRADGVRTAGIDQVDTDG